MTTARKYANDGSYESIERQLEGLATKFFARAAAIGIAMDRDDVVQELRIAYLKSKSSWKPDGGARFSTYFQTCACRHFNDRISKEENERAKLGMGSMSALADKWGEEGDDVPVGIEAAMGVEDAYEDAKIRIEEMKERLGKLSADGRLLVMRLLVAERDKADLKLSDICIAAQITGVRLKAVRAELRASFGVVWR